MPSTNPKVRRPNKIPAASTLFRRYRLQVLTILFGCLTAWFLFTWALAIQRIFHYYNPFPAWDYWRVPYDAFLYKTLGFHIFFKPHNEHRIVFPEIVYLFDLLFHGRLILPIVFSFLCYFLTWIILAWVICHDHTISQSAAAFGALMAGILMGWPGSAVVVGDPFLLQWTLSSLCVLISVFCIVRAGAKTGRSFLVVALIAAVIATYSSGNCLLLWPVLLLEAWFLRLTRWRMAAVVITAVVSVTLYFIGYHPNSKLDIATLILHPIHTLCFVASYMSMPFGLSRSDAFGICLGFANILVIALLFTYAYRKRLLRIEAIIVLFCIYFFILLTAALTTVGRMTLEGYGDAKASRFWVIPLIGWSDLVLLGVYFTARVVLKSRTRLSIYAVLVILIAYGTLKLRSSLAYDDNQFANRQLAELSFEDGLQDRGLTRRIFPDPGFVFNLLPYLEKYHLSVYSLHSFYLLGKPAAAVGRIVSESRSGAVISTLPVEGGIEIIGWAEPDRNGGEPIFLLNEQHEIVGFGRKLPAGFPFDLRNTATPVSEAWVGFVNLKYKAQTVSPFFLSHGRLEPINATIPIQINLQRTSQDAGILLTGIEWHKDPAWTINGFPPMQYIGNVPRGTIYASWSGDDRNKGQIRSSVFPAPTTGCLLIPLSHGTFAPSLAVEVLNADTNQPVINIPMQSGDMGWQFWKIAVDKSITHLRIIAQDQGSNWGQWLAIAQPSQCNGLNR